MAEFIKKGASKAAIQVITLPDEVKRQLEADALGDEVHATAFDRAERETLALITDNLYLTYQQRVRQREGGSGGAAACSKAAGLRRFSSFAESCSSERSASTTGACGFSRSGCARSATTAGTRTSPWWCASGSASTGAAAGDALG